MNFDYDAILAESAKPAAKDSGPTGPKPQKSYEGEGKLTDFEVAEQCVDLIPVAYADNYAEWIKAGAAFHSVDNGERGFALWRDFSKRSAKYAEGECERKWKSFGDRQDGATVATLVKWVQDAGGKLQFYRSTDKRAHVDESDSQPTVSGLENAPAFSNFENVVVRDEEEKKALPIMTVSEQLFRLTGDYPKRIANLLFCPSGDEIRWLESPEALFAWIAELTCVRWAGGAGIDGANMTPKAEFYAHLQNRAQNFKAVETMPHVPRVEGCYYHLKPTKYQATGKHLTELLAYFDNAESPELVRAMFCTAAWGGMAGTRPGFAITAPDRGCGKSTLADALAELYGGAIDIDSNGNGEDRITSRILSPNALTKRVVRIDNLKKQLSSGTIEGLITSTVINGHRLYQGDAERPNMLTFTITGNGLRLSRDMAERCFFIRLRKPKPRDNWRETVFGYIRDNRDKILADIVMQLQAPRRGNAADRWQGWVTDVLSRCCADPAAVCAANQSQRNECDDDLDDALTIMQQIDAELANRNSTQEWFFISSTEMCGLVNEATGVKRSAKSVKHLLEEHIEAGRLPRIQRAERSNKGCGYNVRRSA